ncbi:cytochrome P450 [Tomitella gaofuii]|uniref:cytochrome P450 n=1 Tax=Tomitella gaofuii TaxID=2760083 RepID=UPI0015F811F8|nr:cytochrome P450 [Tomitella gaofuii]
MTKPNIPEGFDPTDPELMAERVPHDELAELRRHAPVHWIPQPREVGGFDDDGYWAVTSHELIREVSRDDKTYSSWENTAIVRFADYITREQIEMQRTILLNQDAPEHTKLRGIISRGFTPRAIATLRSALTERAEQIVGEANKDETGDFVSKVAAELPLQAIAELLGVPQEDRGQLFRWTNEMMGYDDPANADVDPAMSSMEMLGYAYNMAEKRREEPADDIITKLLDASIDGEALSSEEFGFFVLLLAVAGNETTRNAITHGVLAFMDNPEQWKTWRDERPKTMADEVVRWATPVTVFQRTATCDTELGGKEIKKGDRVAMFYISGNRDEEVFDDPYTFDITRDPNPHLGFGGTGAHFCIGTHLARLEIELIFNAIADVMPDIAKLGEAERLPSAWLNGIKELEVDFTGKCPVAH